MKDWIRGYMTGWAVGTLTAWAAIWIYHKLL